MSIIIPTVMYPNFLDGSKTYKDDEQYIIGSAIEDFGLDGGPIDLEQNLARKKAVRKQKIGEKAKRYQKILTMVSGISGVGAFLCGGATLLLSRPSTDLALSFKSFSCLAVVSAVISNTQNEKAAFAPILPRTMNHLDFWVNRKEAIEELQEASLAKVAERTSEELVAFDLLTTSNDKSIFYQQAIAIINRYREVNQEKQDYQNHIFSTYTNLKSRLQQVQLERKYQVKVANQANPNQPSCVRAMREAHEVFQRTEKDIEDWYFASMEVLDHSYMEVTQNLERSYQFLKTDPTTY